MKIRNLLILILLAIVALVVVNVISRKDETDRKETQIPQELKTYRTFLATRISLDNEVKVAGEIQPATKRKIVFSVNGSLEKGDVPLKVGQSFKFNQLLAKVNMKEIFDRLSSSKLNMENTLTGILPELESKSPGQKRKWNDFLTALDPSRRLPDFPILNSKEEGDVLRSTGFLKEYVRAAKLEDEIELYFYLAPFDGTIERVYKKAGSQIKNGTVVAVIAKKGASNAVFSLSANQLAGINRNEMVTFFDASGNEIGSGKIIRVPRTKTELSNVIFSFKPTMGNSAPIGKLYLSVRSDQQCFKVPAKALNGKTVKILQGDQVVEREITIIRQENDTVYLNGLKENEEVILP